MTITLLCVCDAELRVEYSDDSELRAGIEKAMDVGWTRADGRLANQADEARRESVAEEVAATLSDTLNLAWRCLKHGHVK
jgi:hypothetical protein